MHRQPLVITAACSFTVAVVAVGYALLGWLPAVLFALGYVGGLILWLTLPTNLPVAAIRGPYFLTLALFVLHKLEERYLGFFPALSRITGIAVPEADSILAMLLYSFAAAWLLIPWLVGRGSPFGYFLAWTFFVSMGVTELAHFAFPFLEEGPYRYFPGMATALGLVPAAWWGILRMLTSDASMRHG